MQHELLAENPGTKIRLFAVNLPGLDPFVPLAASFGSLPILQDTPADNVWGSWNATWRDVVMIDSANVRADTYNLSLNDLKVPANYAELKSRLKAVAGEP